MPECRWLKVFFVNRGFPYLKYRWLVCGSLLHAHSDIWRMKKQEYQKHINRTKVKCSRTRKILPHLLPSYPIFQQILPMSWVQQNIIITCNRRNFSEVPVGALTTLPCMLQGLQNGVFGVRTSCGVYVTKFEVRSCPQRSTYARIRAVFMSRIIESFKAHAYLPCPKHLALLPSNSSKHCAFTKKIYTAANPKAPTKSYA